MFKVFFDDNGDFLVFYSIINYCVDNEIGGWVEIVGIWEVGSFNFNISFIIWNNGLMGIVLWLVCSEICKFGFW